MFKKLFGKGPSDPTPPRDPVSAAKQTFEDLKAQKGPTDPDTLQALFALGQTLNSHRRFDEATMAGTELLTTFEDNFGPDHPNVGYGLDILATAAFGQAKYETALAYRKRSVTLLQNHFGPDHEMTLQRARLLAVNLVETGDLDDAQKTLDQYMPAAQAIPPLYADYMDTKSFVTQATDGPEAAIPILEELIAFFREHGQDQSANFASKLFNLSQLYGGAERKLDALHASSEAGMIALQSYGPDHPAAQEIFAFQTNLREAHERGEF